MEYRREKDGIYLVRLEKGELIIPVLEKFADQNGIMSGSVTGIGAIEDPEIGYFDVANSEYKKKVFKGEYEILSLSGNISIKDGRPFLHLHLVMSDVEYSCKGGHLFSGKVAATAEIFIIPISKIERKQDPATGLMVWSL